ncbi:MAG: hypothetical protein M3550_06810, partial [Actinomycetota bacterium]|nr:hypothetical protein [Actinomycetota bacterium]
MLQLEARPMELLRDEVLPIEVRLLPADLAVIDRVLDDPAVLAPVACALAARGRAARPVDGPARPSDDSG